MEYEQAFAEELKNQTEKEKQKTTVKEVKLSNTCVS
jgi:hypothetical protein